MYKGINNIFTYFCRSFIPEHFCRWPLFFILEKKIKKLLTTACCTSLSQVAVVKRIQCGEIANGILNSMWARNLKEFSPVYAGVSRNFFQQERVNIISVKHIEFTVHYGKIDIKFVFWQVSNDCSNANIGPFYKQHLIVSWLALLETRMFVQSQ